MQSTTSVLASAADALPLHVYRWLSDADAPRAVVQISHGLAEHAGRYARLAEALTGAGFAVYANDHRGHGRSVRTADDLGLLANEDGWRRAIDDLAQLNQHIASEHPGLPRVLIAHSMGSFLAQQFLADHGDRIVAAVLSGSTGAPPAIATVGKLVARIERARLGRNGASTLLDAMSFGAYNKPFEPARTKFDWLSRDPAEVDRYVADPLCGFVAKTQTWVDMLDGLTEMSRPANQSRIPKNLPVYVIAGTEDPVGERTRGLKQLLGAYARAGLTRVEHRFYAGARHEIFNETNRDEVTADMIAWLDRALANRTAA